MPTSVSDARFLLLSTREEDDLAHDEHASVARFLEVPQDRVQQIRLEAAPMPDVDVRDYAGIILGGSPFTASTPKKQRSDVQKRVEKELQKVFRALRSAHVPFLGLCYGVGTFGRYMGGTVDATFAENTAAVALRVTAAGRADRILADVPENFHGIVGHKEALSALPPDAVLLVTGTECPFQMWRLGTNQYVTQFHPEMNVDSLIGRMNAYRKSGYFSPDQFDAIVEGVRGVDVSASHLVLRNFGRLALADLSTRPAAAPQQSIEAEDAAGGPAKDVVGKDPGNDARNNAEKAAAKAAKDAAKAAKKAAKKAARKAAKAVAKTEAKAEAEAKA